MSKLIQRKKMEMFQMPRKTVSLIIQLLLKLLKLLISNPKMKKLKLKLKTKKVSLINKHRQKMRYQTKLSKLPLRKKTKYLLRLLKRKPKRKKMS
jgi:hypothetical protein